MVGYELQKVLAVVDWFDSQHASTPIGVIGWGEGGLLSLYAGASDTRIDAVCVSGYFDSRQEIWREPLDRNIFGLLEQFGDAELATMIAPRHLVIEAAMSPETDLPGNGGTRSTENGRVGGRAKGDRSGSPTAATAPDQRADPIGH